MKAFKNKVDNFFKWVKGSELVLLEEIDVTEDPVRPHLNLDFRTSYGRQIYGLEYDNNIEGIVCIAFTDEIPRTEKELEIRKLISSKLDRGKVDFSLFYESLDEERNYSINTETVKSYFSEILNKEKFGELINLMR